MSEHVIPVYDSIQTTPRSVRTIDRGGLVRIKNSIVEALIVKLSNAHALISIFLPCLCSSGGEVFLLRGSITQKFTRFIAQTACKEDEEREG